MMRTNQRPLVLVADDDPGIRVLVEKVIRRLGLDTLAAGDGAAAVQFVAEHKEALCCAILDVRMPILNGLDATRAIRQIAPDLTVVLMSAALPGDYEEQIAPLDIAHVLIKPFALTELRAVMRPFYDAPRPAEG